MTSVDPQAPATKQDIKDVLVHFTEIVNGLHEEMKEWKTGLHEQMKEWKKEIIHEFKVVAEDIRHDFHGAFKDRLSLHDDRLQNHEERIVILEQR